MAETTKDGPEDLTLEPSATLGSLQLGKLVSRNYSF